MIKEIQEKLKKYMLENNYYQVAILLIMQFSKSYDEYYKKLLAADEICLEYMERN